MDLNAALVAVQHASRRDVSREPTGLESGLASMRRHDSGQAHPGGPADRSSSGRRFGGRGSWDRLVGRRAPWASGSR